MYNCTCNTDFVITVDEIKTIVSQSNNSAAGYDELPPVIMKKMSDVYAIPLTYLINLFFLVKVIF